MLQKAFFASSIPAILVTCLLLIGGCGKSDSGKSSSKSSDSSSADTSKSSPVVAAPGMASGMVTDADKKPIKIDGAQIEVHVSGVTKDNGQKVTYSAVPDAGGHYSMKIADGRYQATCTIQVPFGGETFMYDLIPTGPKPPHDDQDSGDGPVFNFEWHIRGLRLDAKKDPQDWTQWCGGPVNVKFDRFSLPADPTTKAPIFPAAGTKFVFTLTPTTPLVDGSTGKPLTFERGYDTVMVDADNGTLNDIPLGNYDLTGKQINPDGTQHDLIFSVSTDQKNFAPKVKADFLPRGIAKEAMGQLYVFRAQYNK